MSKTYTKTMIVMAICYILVGLVLIIWPEQSRLTICYVLGGALLIYGAYRIIAYFSRSDIVAAMQFGVAIGIACVLLGILLLFKAKFVVTVFGVIVGATLIIDSILRLQVSFDIRRMGGVHWTPVCICALCMLTLGVLLLLNPFKVIATATILSGIALVIDGILTLWSVLQTGKLIKSLNRTATTSRVR
ncbi:MAG: DUF308 domain-containing protein [Clostridia bacterium]